MRTLKDMHRLFPFFLLKTLAIFSATFIMVSGMGYDCHSTEVTIRKAHGPVEMKTVEKKEVHRVNRVRQHADQVTVKETVPQQGLQAEDAIKVESVEIQVAPIPIDRAYKPVRSVSRALPIRLTKEDIHNYVDELNYGETIDDMEYAAKVLGSRGMTGYINANDPIVNDVYNALVSAFRQSNDEILLRETAESLGREDAGSVLVNYLSYGEYNSVKSSIIWSLGRLQYKGAVNTLIRILQTDNNRGLRINSASSLGVIGDRSAVYPLISALNDNDRDVRKTVIGALGNIGAQEAKYQLTNILNTDNDLELREEAARALRKIEDSREYNMTD